DGEVGVDKAAVEFYQPPCCAGREHVPELGPSCLNIFFVGAWLGFFQERLVCDAEYRGALVLVYAAIPESWDPRPSNVFRVEVLPLEQVNVCRARRPDVEAKCVGYQLKGLGGRRLTGGANLVTSGPVAPS